MELKEYTQFKPDEILRLYKKVGWTAYTEDIPALEHGYKNSAAPEALDMAPAIIRTYAISFMLLPFNIFSTYYFQAIMKPNAAFIVSVTRGLVISGILILVLPAVTGAQSLWFAMPITELLTMFCAASAIRKYTAALPDSE